MGESLNIQMAVNEGISYAPLNKQEVGFLTMLKVGATTFKVDQETTKNPVDASVLKCVAVLESLDWEMTAIHRPMVLRGYISANNKLLVETLRRGTSANDDVEFNFVTFKWDMRPKASGGDKWFKRFECKTTNLKGHILVEGGINQIHASETATAQYANLYNFSITITPEPIAQATFYAAADGHPQTIAWGAAIAAG